MLKNPASDRQARLNAIPEPYRKLVAARLEEWDITPPTLKEDILKYQDDILKYEASMQRFLEPGGQGDPRNDPTLKRWLAVPDPQRQQMYGTFKRYVELSEDERERVLNVLPTADREQTEKALEPIAASPKSQQEQYLAAFEKFSSMTQEARDQFMRNAARWKKMSETERQAWRDLVKQWPPFPYGYVPPHAPPLAGRSSAGQTNPTTSQER